jgi:PPIC-type PPIASE domain/SurA-like N-terminal domain
VRRACLHMGLLGVALLALVGCSGGADAPPVRVGHSSISGATISHWMAIMAPRHVVPRLRGQYDALRREVLELLISQRWLVEQAAEQGLGVTAQEVSQRLAQRRRSFGGEAGFDESLRAIDHSLADLETELRGEIAAEKLRRRALEGAPAVTRAQIASYYDRHRADFYVPEQRHFYIVENLKSAAAARTLRREFLQGRRSIARNSLRESLYRGQRGSPAEHRIIYNAIFAAKLRVLTQPILINHFYFLVEITRIEPSKQRTLAEASGEIARKLTGERRRRALAAFTDAWAARWRARTSCSPGYVVHRCRQYRGPRTGHEALALA